MPFRDLQAHAQRFFGPALALRRLLPAHTRHTAQHWLFVLTATLFVLTLLASAFEHASLSAIPALTTFGAAMASRFMGLFLISFALLFVLFALEAMHRSYYFRGLEAILTERVDSEHVPVSWEIATIVDATAPEDITEGFIMHELGQEILFRAGVPEESFLHYVESRVSKLDVNGFLVERDQGVTIETYATSLYKQDEELRALLSTHNINKEAFLAAAAWVMNIERARRAKERWWSRDNLGRIPGLAKTWSYGETYLLERYGHDLKDDPLWEGTAMMVRAEDDEVEAMEAVLARARQSNVLLVAEDPNAARKSACLLYRKISAGTILPSLEEKRIFMIDTETMVTAKPDKSAFESALRETLNQAVHAGNTILYFENLPVAIKSTSAYSVDLVDILVPYFESSAIQIIIGSDSDGYHRVLSRDGRIMRACDLVQTHGVEKDALHELLRQRATTREAATGIIFSAPAIDAIAQLADRYFPGGVMPDKAYDLLEEMIPYALQHGTEQVLREHVEALVNKKTGVPVGKPDEKESAKLLSLEQLLHERVVGQDVAVSAVARALRRARAGTGNPNKPVGSFLFLGPTGVGKTETAKALAEALFGNERMMNRLDMSEFQGANALEELIGSFETGVPGRLTSMIRDNQYGVLLLDELEKAAHGVHDLLLQLLDEGKFSDVEGKDVNARNLIIIATSNAGAKQIWAWEQEGKNVVEQKRELIDHLIREGLYRPELLNRFDDIVVFHSLTKDHMQNIARIHLTKLAKRLRDEKNIMLEVTDTLVQKVAENGYDPQFGGRALNRAIQEEVEQTVADSILQDTLHAGQTITYTSSTGMTKS